MSTAMQQPLEMGAITLPNRFVMAPLTRSRATEHTHVPTDSMAAHYAQRASAGLLIAEATMVAEHQSAFWKEPGAYSEEQVDGWRKVTDAVHAKGGRIFLQIWHGGRAAHPINSQLEVQPVAPSAIAVTAHQIAEPHNRTGTKIPYAVPRELKDEEIPEIVGQFVRAAKNAVAAGFDGVEIHGANGYLLDEFLRDGSNKRTGPYGGALENRARLLLEVTEAVSAAIGAGRVGVRLSPLNSYNDMTDSAPEQLTAFVASKLSELKIAFLHLIRKDLHGDSTQDVLTPARANFKGVLITNAGYTPAEAEEAVKARKADAVAFGTLYLSNPDLVERVAAGAPLNPVNWMTLFGGEGDAGYNDYPTLA